MKFVGIKEFRAHIAEYVKKAQTSDARYIVMNHNVPLFEIKAFADDSSIEKLFLEVMKAKEDVRKGNVYTEEEIMAEFM